MAILILDEKAKKKYGLEHRLTVADPYMTLADRVEVNREKKKDTEVKLPNGRLFSIDTKLIVAVAETDFEKADAEAKIAKATKVLVPGNDEVLQAQGIATGGKPRKGAGLSATNDGSTGEFDQFIDETKAEVVQGTEVEIVLEEEFSAETIAKAEAAIALPGRRWQEGDPLPFDRMGD